MSEWRGEHLYFGKLYVGSINKWINSSSPRHGMWRGWFMSEEDGSETGWFATADEARASIETALADALPPREAQAKEMK